MCSRKYLREVGGVWFHDVGISFYSSVMWAPFKLSSVSLAVTVGSHHEHLLTDAIHLFMCTSQLSTSISSTAPQSHYSPATWSVLKDENLH